MVDENTLVETHRDILLDFAKKYIWWESPQEALRRPYRVLASAMNLGSLEDYQRIRQSFDPELLPDVLQNAEAGWFTKRSWSFWHRIIDLVDINETVPPLPERVFQAQSNTYTILLPMDSEYVKLSFFGGIDFGRIGEPGLTKDKTLLVASFKDLMATKVKVLMQRIEKKDYIDIAALISHGVSLEEGLAGASLLFGKEFSPPECLRALQYFDEPALSDLDESVKRSLKEAVERVLALGSLPELKITSFSLR